MKITIKEDGNGLERFANAFQVLGEQSTLALGRALNHTGVKAKTQVIRALTKQTGLRRAVIVRAVKVNGVKYGNPKIGRLDADLTYTLETSGGDISLKYFGAREIRAGVSAKPWGKRQVYAGAFMRGGLWPKRVTLQMGGHAFKRAAGKRLPVAIQKSGLFIPDEMVQGATLAAFEEVVNRDLANRVGHELDILLRMNGL